MDILVSASGVLRWNNKEFKCVLGKNGIVKDKKEGDGATPSGCFSIREVMYREDRIERPQTDLILNELQKNDGWCDDVNNPNYNRKITLPYPASHEVLWREDNLYDIIGVLGYNDDPVLKSKGSAIFIHIASSNYTSTAGCIALSSQDLLEILREVSRESKVCIQV